MDVTGQADVAAPIGAVRAVVRDLGTYPRWLTIVQAADAEPDGARPAWTVEIGARVGPLRRSKRLRMVRAHEGAGRVGFERAELDGAEHGRWELEVTTEASAAGALVGVRLTYEGRAAMLAPVLVPVLQQEIRSAGPRLAALANGG